jgi:hypothetical protein
VLGQRRGGDARKGDRLRVGWLNQLNEGWIFESLWLGVQIGRAFVNTYMESCLGDLESITFRILRNIGVDSETVKFAQAAHAILI